MNRIVTAVLIAILSSACASSSFLNRIDKVTQRDINNAIAINSDSAIKDGLGMQCAIWIGMQKPVINRVLSYPTSGPLSAIAKRRAIETLKTTLRPQFEAACAPVLMDERQRLARFALLFGE